MITGRRPAVFLDRDGTIIEDAGYPRDRRQLRLRRGVAPALQELRRRGFVLVVVSNQSGIGRGIISAEEMHTFHDAFVAAFDALGIRFDAVEYCPHAPDADCDCRKPRPGLLERAARNLDLDVPASWIVGDKETDMQAGHAIGCRTMLLASSEHAESMADVVAKTWEDAVEAITHSTEAVAG